MWYKEWSFEWRTNKWSFQWTNDRNGWKSQSHEWKLLGLQPPPVAKVTWTWELRTSRNRPGIMYWWCRETNETVQRLTLADRNPLSLSLTPMTTWQRRHFGFWGSFPCFWACGKLSPTVSYVFRFLALLYLSFLNPFWSSMPTWISPMSHQTSFPFGTAGDLSAWHCPGMEVYAEGPWNNNLTVCGPRVG